MRTDYFDAMSMNLYGHCTMEEIFMMYFKLLEAINEDGGEEVVQLANEVIYEIKRRANK